MNLINFYKKKVKGSFLYCFEFSKRTIITIRTLNTSNALYTLHIKVIVLIVEEEQKSSFFAKVLYVWCSMRVGNIRPGKKWFLSRRLFCIDFSYVCWVDVREKLNSENLNYWKNIDCSMIIQGVPINMGIHWRIRYRLFK